MEFPGGSVIRTCAASTGGTVSISGGGSKIHKPHSMGKIYIYVCVWVMNKYKSKKKTNVPRENKFTISFIEKPIGVLIKEKPKILTI